MEFCSNLKRKSREMVAQGTPAMPKDSSALHVQKVHREGAAIDDCPIEYSDGSKEAIETNCLGETSNHSSDSGKSAKLRLFDICSTQQWSSPVYELCELVNSGQNTMFKYKVKVLINKYSLTVLECFSAPNCQSEAAQEHAAEGALWYLNHLGYC